MKVLITGGFGYLGGRLSQYLQSKKGYELILGSQRRHDIPLWVEGVDVVQIYWCSPENLYQICAGIDVIVHLAGMNAQDCMADPTGAFRVNGDFTAKLLASAISQKVKRFIYLSTAHVYDSPLAGHISELNKPINNHPYATSHLAGEKHVLIAHQKREIEGVVIRLSNSFGAPAHKGANCWMLVVNDLCRQMIRDKKMVIRSTGLDKRDFITLTDACSAIKHLIDLTSELLGDGIFNVGGLWVPTIREMATRIAVRGEIVMGEKVQILYNADAAEQKSKDLDYSIKKLMDTGFQVNHKNIDTEIDGLIHFCSNNFA